jgi:TRAP-type mannitol/chloroaromatic compound transport system permease large subunit
MEVVALGGVALLLLALNIPIAAALGVAAVLTIWVFGIAPLDLVPAIAYATVSRFTLLAVPYFIAAGYLMERSGIADRLIRLAQLIVGSLPGGLAYVPSWSRSSWPAFQDPERPTPPRSGPSSSRPWSRPAIARSSRPP